MARKPQIEVLLATSARVGSLLVPARSLESCLGGFAHPLTIWTHDDAYIVSLFGSSIGLIHSGKLVLVCSKHQLRDQELSDVGLLLEDGSCLITSSGSRTFHQEIHTEESDSYDLAAFDFSEPASDYPELSRNFFDFQKVPPDTPNTHVLAFVIAGYPSQDQKYELEDKKHLGLVRRVLVAEPESQPADNALLKLKFVQPLNFDPDGLSGGPAFVIQLVDGEPQVFLGGMIVRSGKSHCYILKSAYIWSFLSSFH